MRPSQSSSLEGTTHPAFEEAETLAASERWREAIEVLSDANRRDRDACIEQRLVRLRHEAFEPLRHANPPPWPPPVSCHAPPGAPPEVGLEGLNGELLTSSILEAGCLLVRGLVPRSRVDELVDGIERAFNAYDAVEGGLPALEAVPWFERFSPLPKYQQHGIPRFWVRNGGGILAADSPRLLFDLLETMGEAGIPEVVAGHLGEWPALSVNKTTLRRVSKDTDAQWHQDGSFLGTDIRTVNVWLALTGCGEVAPGLDILPRRLDHLVETGTPGVWFDWAAAADKVEEAAGEVQLCRPIFEPGDGLLFDHLFMHRTAAGPDMTTDRYGVEMWFFAPSLYPADQIPLVV
jgi:hypothetical protein